MREITRAIYKYFKITKMVKFFFSLEEPSFIKNHLREMFFFSNKKKSFLNNFSNFFYKTENQNYYKVKKRMIIIFVISLITYDDKINHEIINRILGHFRK